MDSRFEPLFCFVYSIYDDNSSYFRERDDYILIFHKREENSEIVEVLVNVQDLTIWPEEKDKEGIKNLKKNFGKIICNSEVTVNDYDFLTHEKIETFKSIVVQIFKLLSQRKIKYHYKECENPFKKELFEKIWTELKEVYYSSELGDLM